MIVLEACVNSDEILDYILDHIYPDLHETRNALDPLGPEPHSRYGCLRHTLCNMRNALEYHEENKKKKLNDSKQG